MRLINDRWREHPRKLNLDKMKRVGDVESSGRERLSEVTEGEDVMGV